MFGYQALADSLLQEGSTTLFALSGDDTLQMLSTIALSKRARIIKARREACVVAMADAYARATGNVGVCSVTTGPGLANAANAFLTASRAKSPVVCIAPQPPVIQVHLKFMDQARFAEAVETRFIPVRKEITLAMDVQTAFRHARLGGGPVILAVPNELMNTALDYEWDYRPSATVLPPPQRVQPDSEIIARAVEMLRAAERPLIVAGRGAVQSGADEEIVALASRTGALIAHTLPAKGYLADHPRNLGVVGGFATDLAHDLFYEADCVLAVGCSLSMYSTELGLLFQEAPLIHIDHNPSQIGKTIPASLGIVGDARASLAALNCAMDRRDIVMVGSWGDELESKIASERGARLRSYRSAPTPPDTIDPRQMVAVLDEVLPPGRVVVSDPGLSWSWPADLSVAQPSCYQPTHDFQCVGMALYHGIGQAIGRPGERVVVMIGDGGFMMSVDDLDTAVRYRVPLTVVIMNDNGFGAEVAMAKLMHQPADVALYENPEFAEVARAFGAEGYTVRSAEDLRAIAPRLAASEGPVVVDVKITPEVLHECALRLLARYGVSEED